MPLRRNFGMDDPRFTKQLDSLERRHQFIRELATVILSRRKDFESVWSIANRVYDRHSPPSTNSLNRRRYEQPAGTALSA
jgi:hypothetical protein